MFKLLPARRAVLLSSLLLAAGASAADTALVISNQKATNDGTYVYYEFDYTGTPNFFRVFIDADTKAGTGYTKGGVGAEFMIENGVLYKYQREYGGVWDWKAEGVNDGRVAGYWVANGKARLMVKRSSIGAEVSAGQSDDLVFDIQDATTFQTSDKLRHDYSLVTVPTLERFELVTTDGLQKGAQSANGGWSPDNDWGGHMSRVATAADGTVYMLNLMLTGAGNLQEGWQLRKRAQATGTWQVVASGLSFDEAHLLMSPKDGKVYVIAHPDGKPAIGVEPSFAMQPIAGGWSQVTVSQRHYGNAGIGENGQICLKASVEWKDTSSTDTQYNCSTETQGALTFEASTFDSKRIGNRSVYDYIFPGVVANSLFYTASQLDLTKEVAGYPRYTGNNYVFNGMNGFVFPEARRWDVFTPLGVGSPQTATVAPELQQIDAYVDSKGRAFSIALKRTTDGISPLSGNSYVLSVTDPATGQSIYPKPPVGQSTGTLAGLTTGSGRIVEDAHKNLYLIWTWIYNSTMLKVYRLNETLASDGSTSFSISLAADLSSSFAPFDKGWTKTAYATTGRGLYIAAPRGGTARSGAVDGYLNACSTELLAPDQRPNVGFNMDSCYGATKTEQMKLVYFRIRLPD